MIVSYWKTKLTQVCETLFADDMTSMAESEEKLQRNIELPEKELTKINIDNSKTMIITKENKIHRIKIQEKPIVQVESFKYMGSIMESNEKIDKE